MRGSVVRIALLVLIVGAVEAIAQQRPGQEHEVRIARVHYDGGGDWYSGEASVPTLLAFVREHTLLDVPPREDIVRLDSDKLFQYQYLYLNGHGNVVFSEREVRNLRRFLANGGFIHINDDYGMDPFIRRELRKVFPDQELTDVPLDHPIYNIHFHFPEGIPKIHEHDGKPAQGLGLYHEGRLVVFYSYESDLGDGWEPPEVHNTPEPLRLKALRMGTNLLLYAMTE
jgi:hypothetical protein